MDHTIVHFEIPANEPEKLSKFYSELLGWKFKKVEMPGDPYWMIQTRAKEQDPGVDGGLFKKMEPTQGVLHYYNVESVEDFSRKVEKLGGKVIRPKTEIPTIGHFAIANDPEGNVFGLFESLPR